MSEERFWFLVSLQLSGEAQPVEQKELESYLKENPEMGFQKEMLTLI